MTLSTLSLKPQADRRIRKGHLWIYSNEVDTQKTPLSAFQIGETAIVINNKGKSLGIATVNPNALLCGRLLSSNAKMIIDLSFFIERITQALALRDAYFSKPFYRLIYGDADFLPGVVADRFGDHLVVQITTAGMEEYKEQLIQAFQEVLSPKGIILQNDHSARSLENLPDYVDFLGDVPKQLSLEENNTRFDIPSQGGQKTGWFYDHRINRAQLQHWTKEKTVLDVFSYVGGWGLQAAQAGAKSVTCVDVSAQALELVNHNASINQLTDRVHSIQGKALDVLKQQVADNRQYDIVVLDPPAFVKRRKDQKSGEAAYRHHNELAIRLLAPGGLLVSGSCSMHLGKGALTQIVGEAAHNQQQLSQLVYVGGQGPDHPVHPMIPETDYLKAQFFRILPR